MDITKPHVAVLGLGIMGAGMARRLLAAGFPSPVYNRSPGESRCGASGKGSQHRRTKGGRGADVIFSMVADDTPPAPSGWANGARSRRAPGAVCIECSTVTPGWIRELAEPATTGCELLDAPVTGSRAQAAAGELKFLVGGAAARSNGCGRSSRDGQVDLAVGPWAAAR